MEFSRFVPVRKGWRFCPTEKELINDFLKQKNDGLLPDIDEIPEVDVCKFEPWELPNKSLINSDLEWFFFSPCERKYLRGCRKNRMTKVGHWKATGKDRNIKSQSKLIGKKRTLVFYQGHASNDARTNWVIHEYQENGVDGREAEGAYVLCRLKKRVDEDANSNYDDELRNDITPTTMMSFPDNTHVGDAVEQFETPLNQGIPVSSARQAERLEAGEADNVMLYPLILEEGHCISQMSEAKLTDGVDGHGAEAKLTEVQSLLQSFESLDNPQCLSSLDDNMHIGLGHPCRDLPLIVNCGMGQQMGVEQDCLDEGRENDKPAITGVNRQLGSAELKALLIHKLNLLHLANQSQNKAPLNMEGNKVIDANSTAISQSKWRIDARKSKGLVTEEETKHETKTVRAPQRLKWKNAVAPQQ